VQLRLPHQARILFLGLIQGAILLPRSAAQNPRPTPPSTTGDEQLAGVAKRVPGFAGLWLQGCTVVLVLVDTTQREAALGEVADRLPPKGCRRIRVQRAQFDFIQLYAWKQLVVQQMMYSTNMTGVDADEVRNRVVVSVADSSSLAPVRDSLLALGIPSSALLFEVAINCTLVFDYGLNIVVTDSVAGSPPAQAILIATSTGYVDSVGPARPFRLHGEFVLILPTAGERPGTYSVVVRSPGYRDWTRSNIQVTADRCHVRPLVLRARLQPL
jgi:hypothetical protein